MNDMNEMTGRIVDWLHYWVAQVSLYGPLAVVGIRRWKSIPGTELRSRGLAFMGHRFQVYYRHKKRA